AARPSLPQSKTSGVPSSWSSIPSTATSSFSAGRTSPAARRHAKRMQDCPRKKPPDPAPSPHAPRRLTWAVAFSYGDGLSTDARDVAPPQYVGRRLAFFQSRNLTASEQRNGRPQENLCRTPDNGVGQGRYRGPGRSPGRRQRTHGLPSPRRASLSGSDRSAPGRNAPARRGHAHRRRP